MTPGIYKGYADPVSVEVTETKNGNDCISFDVNVGSDTVPQNVRVYLVITEKTKDWVWKKLTACGWDGDDLDTLEGLGSKEVSVEIKEEEYMGRTKLRADIVLRKEKRTGLSSKYGKGLGKWEL